MLYVVVKLASKRYRKGEVVSTPLIMPQAKSKRTRLEKADPNAVFVIRTAS